jgi:hypothetical protein
MPQIGGKNSKRTSSDSKRHFTVVMGNKEHGLYVSSTPSSAAKKAVTKLCASNKGKKVEFHIREITQGSKKKTYGPYNGYIEKLKEPIELKGRVIKYKPVAKLIVKKGGMYRSFGGSSTKPGVKQKCIHNRKHANNIDTTLLRKKPSQESEDWATFATGRKISLKKDEPVEILEIQIDPDSGEEFGKVERNGVPGWVRMKYITSCEIMPENAQTAEVSQSLKAARQLWQAAKVAKSLESTQTIKLPNIPNEMFSENNLPRPSAQRHNPRHSFTTGASSAQRHNFNNSFTPGASSAHRHNFNNSFTPGASSAQRHNPRHSFTPGASSAHRHNFNNSFTPGASSAHRHNFNNSFTPGASSAHAPQNLSKYDGFAAKVYQRAGEYKVEQVSDTKYIIYYPNRTVTMELLLLDDGTPYHINETHETYETNENDL